MTELELIGKLGDRLDYVMELTQEIIKYVASLELENERLRKKVQMLEEEHFL